MHDLDATRIFWKEWRAQRSFWLGLFILAIALELLLVFVVPLLHPTSLLEQFRYHEGLVVVLACSFATGSAAIAFAGEVEAKTKGLLQRVPVRARDLLAGKLSFSLAGSYALFVALWLLGSFVLSESQSIAVSRSIRVAKAEGARVQYLDELRARAAAEESAVGTRAFLDNLPGPFAFVAVGSLFSLILSDVLITVLIAGVSTAVLLAIPIVRDNPAVLCALIAAAVVCDWVLAQRWLVDAGAADWRLIPTISFPRPVIVWRRSSLEHSTTLESTRSAVAWRRAASSLIWKELRQAWPLCLAILLIGLAAITSISWVEHAYWAKGSSILLTIVIVLSPLLPGVAAMRAERKGRAFHLLANHGISVDGLLICKHAVWLTLSLLIFAILLFADRSLLADIRADTPMHSLWTWASGGASGTFGAAAGSSAGALTVAAVHVILLYALGFLLGMLIPGPVVALFTGAIVTVGLLFCWSLVAFLRLPFWWTLGLFPVVFLAVAWVRAADWLTGRSTASAWFKVAAAFFVPMFGILAGTAVYRVIEIPAASVPKAVLESQGASNLAQSPGGKRSLFVDAMNALIGIRPTLGPGFDQDVLELGWQSAARLEWHWVEQNQRARQLAIEASRQEPRSFPSEAGDAGLRNSGSEKMGELARLLFYSARKFESEDELDEALACYVAVARLGRDAARSGQRTPFPADGFTMWALEWMQRWAAHPKQSTNRIQKAIDQFAAFELKPGEISNSVLNDWRLERRDLRRALWGKSSVPETNRTVSELWWARWFLPWELVRLERLFDAFSAANLDEADVIAADLEKQGFVQMTSERAARWGSHGKSALVELATTTLSEPQLVPMPLWGSWHAVDRLALERMRLIALALADYQRAHHKLPGSLQALVPTYFQQVPIDPWTGREFIYRPEGMPPQISYSGGTLPIGVPFLASAGLYDSQIVQRFTTPRVTLTPSFEVVSRFSNNEPRQRSGGLKFPGPMVQLPARVNPPKPDIPIILF